MSHANDLSIITLVLCFLSATACSGERGDEAESSPFQLQGGAAGSAAPAGAAGSPVAGAAGSPVAGTGGGPANTGAPGAAGVVGTGAAGRDDAADAGTPDAAGAPGGEPSPLGEVSFSEAFAVLQVSCTPCHAMEGSFLPAFAQADEAAAYDVTQQSNGDELYYERIIARGVVERTMPPLCSGGMLGATGCLSEEEAAVLQAWVARGALP